MNHNRPIRPLRAALLVALPLLLAGVMLLRLYDLQVLRGEQFYEENVNTVLFSETVPAARGDILDRYGRVLVTNRVALNVSIDRARLVEDEDPNGVLLALIDLAGEAGLAYTDTLPLTEDVPFAYTEMTPAQQSDLQAYIKHFELGEELPPEGLMDWFRKHYDIPPRFTDREARLAAGVRYELEQRALFPTGEYIFAADLDVETVASLEERRFPGVSVTTSAAREYRTSCAAHILGRTGLMDAAELAHYGALGYPMNASVGKNGVEKAFEEALHGRDGKRVTVRTSTGAVVDSYYTEPPQAGGDVTLTLDLDCQQTAERALATEIERINRDRLAAAKENETVQLAESGAVVVLQVGTGEILAQASYPTYNLATFSRDYSRLEADPTAPLFNRALQGAYAPGSTFKGVTATAGLQEGVITPETTIYDEGVLDEYEGYSYSCWVYPGSHGNINVRQALQVSCNYFFYMVGREVGIDKLDQYARAYGLGQPTGIELYEETGALASRAYKEDKLGESWYVGDTLQASIGQSYHLFTPLQLATYAATLASGGTRYASHLLRGVTDAGGAAVYTSQPAILDRVEASQETFDTVREGLLMASKQGSVSHVFGNYPVDVCSKTGTAQVREDVVNNAVFIAFAPYENPEIALAVVVENGGSGSYLAEVARSVFDQYFSKNTETLWPKENVLLP